MQYKNDLQDIWVLFVCEDDERNLCDQKAIEHDLMKNLGIKSMRKTLNELIVQSAFCPKTKVLRVDGNEIGSVYYRTCYQ